MNDSTNHQKPFGLWSSVFLVVANMIGAGVFTTSGYSLADLGDRRLVMAAWLIGGLIALCGAFSYGRLAQRITESGGEYLFLSRLVHPAIGFIAGWVSLLAGFTGAIAFAATAFESYALPESARPQWVQPGMAAIAVVILFGVMHSLFLKTGLWAQNTIVVVKLVLLTGFVWFAFSTFPAQWSGWEIQTEPVDFSVYALASTLVWISLSFSGFNAAVYVTGEVQEPEKNVPRALLIGTLLVAIFYLLLNFIFVYGATPDQISGKSDVAAIASMVTGGSQLAILVRIIVSVALLSSVSSMIVAGPRVYRKMANDGVFPRLFGSGEQNDQAIPAAAIWLQVALASVVIWFSTIKSLLDYLGFTLSISAALTVGCVLWAQPASEGWTKRVFSSTIAIIYVLATLQLATLSAIGQPQQLIGFALTIGSGLVAYGMVAKRRRVQ